MAHNEFYSLMDAVSSELQVGSLWHSAAATAFAQIGLRGKSRWSRSESIGDLKSRLELEKLLVDKCNYIPTITIDMPQVSWQSISDLPTILRNWEASEREFIKTLMQAFKQAAEIDVEVYRKLLDITNEVQGEAFRVSRCIQRYEATDYYHHDVMRSDLEIHNYFRDNPECQKADFSI